QRSGMDPADRRHARAPSRPLRGRGGLRAGRRRARAGAARDPGTGSSTGDGVRATSGEGRGISLGKSPARAPLRAAERGLDVSEQDIEQLSIDTIRTLSMDAVQQANAGHPGTAMALAPLAYLLYTEVMDHSPANPDWPDRDRFVLSAGHACILQYSTLHLSGYNLSLEELKRFRQWESQTPGHPEVHHTAG